MKNRKINFIKLGILLFGFSFLLWSCENEDNVTTEIQQDKKVTKISFNDFKNNIITNKSLETFQKYFDVNKLKNSSINLQSRTESNDDTTIITDEIVSIQETDYTTYTFKIQTETEQNQFYNLILYVNNQQEIFKHHILKYNPIQGWDNSQEYRGTVSISDNDLFDIDNLFSRGDILGQCISEYYGVWECYYGNNHNPYATEGEHACGGSIKSFTYSIRVRYAPCPIGTTDFEFNVTGDIINSPSTGGGSTNNGSGNPEGEIMTAPNLPDDECPPNHIKNSEGICVLDYSDPCNKILPYLNNQNVSFKQELIDLREKTNDTIEHSISVFKNGTETNLSGDGNSNGIDLPYITASPYIVYAHTHDSLGDGDGTFSVFSMQDLLVFATLIHNNSMDGTFVAYLTTDDDTEYALTIDEPSKLIELFYSDLFELPNNFQDAVKWQNLLNKRKRLDRKYFDTKNANAKIKVDSNDNPNDLIEFLNFMKEADAGITLFESNDTFTEFKKVNLDKNNSVVKTPCN